MSLGVRQTREAFPDLHGRALLPVMTPLSGIDMKKFIPDATVMTYRELKKHKALPRLPLVILYETRPHVGHWVIILETPEGIEHFDSYGIKPDGEISFVPTKWRAALGMQQPHLIQLLLDTNRPINFNDWPLQSKGKIATCGRWCALRAKYRDLKCDDFGGMIMKVAKKFNIAPDLVVSSAIH